MPDLSFHGAATMPLHTTLAERTDVGRERTRNEDAVRVSEPYGVVVVADGMGGHPAGDIASRLASEVALERITDLVERVRRGEVSAEAMGEAMADAVRRADERVRSEGRDDPFLEGMGTTLTALFVDREAARAYIGHVGDSRAYRVRDGRLEQLTRDQTWVQDQVDAGRLTPEQARTHPYSSILTQAIGMETPAEPDVMEVPAEPGDVYLVCSDGLVTMLEDEEIEVIVNAELQRGLAPTAESLINAANARGGWDNITVALLSVAPSGTSEGPRSEETVTSAG